MRAASRKTAAKHDSGKLSCLYGDCLEASKQVRSYFGMKYYHIY